MNELFLSNQNEVEVFERCFRSRIPLMIKGPTGCGKSQLVLHMASKLGLKVYSVACNEDTNAADLLGRYIIKGGETIWKDGPITQAVREGAILYLDEVAEAREDVVVAIHPLTDHRREIYLDKLSEVVKAHSNFMFVASYNPGYQRGIKQLKNSTKQRFVTIHMSYLEPDLEHILLCELTNVPKDISKKIVSTANRIRKMEEYQLSETVSTRLLVRASQLIVDGMDPRDACHISIAEPLSEDRQIVGALKDLINLAI